MEDENKIEIKPETLTEEIPERVFTKVDEPSELIVLPEGVDNDEIITDKKPFNFYVWLYDLFNGESDYAVTN